MFFSNSVWYNCAINIITWSSRVSSKNSTYWWALSRLDLFWHICYNSHSVWLFSWVIHNSCSFSFIHCKISVYWRNNFFVVQRWASYCIHLKTAIRSNMTSLDDTEALSSRVSYSRSYWSCSTKWYCPTTTYMIFHYSNSLSVLSIIYFRRSIYRPSAIKRVKFGIGVGPVFICLLVVFKWLLNSSSLVRLRVFGKLYVS